MATWGQLEILVLGADRLKDTEWFGKQDPYAVVRVGNQQFRTKTHHDGGKRPVWNERFTFNLAPDVTEATFTVWEADVIKTDTVIGTVTVPLAGARARGHDDLRPQLRTQPGGKFAGELSVILTFKPAQGQAQPSAPAYAPAQGYGAASAPPYQPAPAAQPGHSGGNWGSLEILVLGADRLKDIEWFGKQDPYAVVRVGGQQYRTKTHVDGGKRPVWNERFTFKMLPDTTEATIQVWEGDTLKADELIGSASVPLAGVRARGHDDVRVQLYTAGGKFAGEVSMVMAFKPGQAQAGQPAQAFAPATPQPAYPQHAAPAHAQPTQYAAAPHAQYGAAAPPAQPAYYPPASQPSQAAYPFGQHSLYPPAQQPAPAPGGGYPPVQPPAPAAYPPPQAGYPAVGNNHLDAAYAAPFAQSAGYPAYPPPAGMGFGAPNYPSV